MSINTRTGFNQEGREMGLGATDTGLDAIRLREIIDGFADAYGVIDQDWKITFCNAEAHRLAKIRLSDIYGLDVRDVFPQFIDTGLIDLAARIFETGGSAEIEMKSVLTPGQWLGIRIFRLSDGSIAGCFRDITDAKKHELSLEASVEAQNVLFRELTHRVANSFSSISALVKLQCRGLSEPARTICLNIGQRIDAMSRVHSRLYRSANVQEQDLADYVEHLAHDLSRSLLGEQSQITLSVDASPGIIISTDRTIVLGMIVSELVMNSTKYAFPDTAAGTITISISESHDLVSLIVSDDGVGVPDIFSFDPETSLGMKIVSRQVETLAGEIDLIPGTKGTQIHVRFPL